MRPGTITVKHNVDTLRGRGFVANLEPPDWERYTHEIRDIGGFWAASFNLLRPRDELIEMFENGLDREIMITAQSGVEVWEGYIDELALQIRGIELRKSLNRMANTVWVRYASGGVSGIRGTVYSDAASIAKYGTKQRAFSGGQAVSAAQVNQAAQVLLSRLKSPDNPSMRWIGGDQEQTTLAIRCKGWWQKFYWQVYNQVALTGTAAASVIIERILNALGIVTVTNYCKNPSFEVNVTDDWTYGQVGAGGSINLDATQYFVGANSARIRAGNGLGYAYTTVGVSVPNGGTVTAQARIRCSADPTGAKAYIKAYRSDGAVAGTAYATSAANGAWEYLTASYRNISGVAKTFWLVLYNNFANSAADVWFDACQLELSSLAGPYTDGTLSCCGWNGTAHNSSSWRTSSFVKNRAIQANDTASQEKYDADMWPADIMKGLAALGDSGFNKWIVGMREGKTFYYEPAAAPKSFGVSLPPALPP
jgi:hypothetical protein